MAEWLIWPGAAFGTTFPLGCQFQPDIPGLNIWLDDLYGRELFSRPHFRSAAKSFNIFNQPIIKSLIIPYIEYMKNHLIHMTKKCNFLHPQLKNH
ncbi:hypothetical protein FC85_GL000833 [Lentilactobacillus diolivorans DSM 14421]|uniref:Uncharacterized protein n=1 Tax=Lentilactobacillus diolivorans DSM 14421 TaxID=1423739 RepID=A0A0R1S7F7_9LACO|nr:hypothetical protein FC85_GL000833 [Lentilactobacillus diolivorans DSM 14421]